MKNINVLLSLFLTLLIISCKNTNFQNPEEVLTNYLKTDNYEKQYDDFLSTKSKENVTKDEYLKIVKNDSTKIENIKLTSVMVDNESATYKRYKIEESLITQKDTTRERFYYTLINENGKWKLIWTGSLMKLAQEQFNKANYSESIKTLKKIIEINPFSGKAFNSMSGCYLKDESIKWHEREKGILENVKYAISLEDDIPDNYNTIAAYYAGFNKNELAIENFNRASNYCLDEKDKVTYLSNIALTYINNRKFPEAEKYLKKCFEVDEKMTHPWFLYGILKIDIGKYNDAKICLEKALGLEKMDNAIQSELYYNYSFCCYKTNDYLKSKEYINKALDMNPTNIRYQKLFEIVNKKI